MLDTLQFVHHARLQVLWPISHNICSFPTQPTNFLFPERNKVTKKLNAALPTETSEQTFNVPGVETT